MIFDRTIECVKKHLKTSDESKIADYIHEAVIEQIGYESQDECPICSSPMQAGKDTCGTKECNNVFYKYMDKSEWNE